MRTLIVSSVVAPVGLKAPVAGLSRLKVVRVVSSTSAMLPAGTEATSTPYFANAAPGVIAVGAAVAAVATSLVYGRAPSCTARGGIVCTGKVYTMATWPLKWRGATRH